MRYAIAGNVILPNFQTDTHVVMSNRLDPVLVLFLAKLQFYAEHFHHGST